MSIISEIRYAAYPKDRIFEGDWESVLRGLPQKSVHCIPTSPPYYRHRKYHAKQETPNSLEVGREEDVDDYVNNLVAGFREARRVLRDDGTLWLNLGDTRVDRQPLLLPARVAFALQADGWILTQEIVWAKPNPQRGANLGRTTPAHEFIHVFAKAPYPGYYYDAEAIGTPYSPETLKQLGEIYEGQALKDYAGTGAQDPSEVKRRIIASLARGWANKLSVWSLTTANYRGNHTATFPVDLPRMCILAGTSEKGCCPECGAPWRRKYHVMRIPTRPGTASKANGLAPAQRGNRDLLRHVTIRKTVGWEPTCDHIEAQHPVPCTVLDPFSGHGTTALAATLLGRAYVAIELYAANCAAIINRLRDAQGDASLVFPTPDKNTILKYLRQGRK